MELLPLTGNSHGFWSRSDQNIADLVNADGHMNTADTAIAEHVTL